MKRVLVGLVFLVSLCATSNSFAFLDYLFSGSSSRDAIDNSAVGDLRAWWSGNPAYQFNPYYSGTQNPGQAPGQQPQQPAQPPQPIVNYYPPSQSGSPYQYEQPQYQPQYQPQAMPQQQAQYGYGQPQQQALQPPQQTYQAQPGIPQYPQQQMAPQPYQYQNAPQ
jgi:hypothetical protein